MRLKLILTPHFSTLNPAGLTIILKMIRLSSLFTLLYLRNSVLTFSHSELPNPFETSCYPRDSCSPFRNGKEDHLWGNYTCECGQHCVMYNTCCVDSPHAGTTLHAEYRGEKCKRLSPYFPEYVILISSCSDRWRYEYRIRDMCERPIGSVEDPVSAMPVTNAAIGVTYKNYFCAMCNFDRDVRLWDMMLLHEAKESDAKESDVFFNVTQDYLLENLSYDREQQSWGIFTDAHSFLRLRLLFGVPPVLQKVVKKCHPGVVTDCDASHASDHGLRYRCLSHYSPVLLKANDGQAPKKYRNVHCAICNNATNVEDLVCGPDVRKRKKPTFSFAHLIDINRSTAGETERCRSNQMWDPFSKKCRSLVCALPGYVVQNGKCTDSRAK